uniref:Uncharacterized protein n=1 Tax=Arundo donax TaxID=35708 RepID=A0A0A9GMN0_ARUDO
MRKKFYCTSITKLKLLGT